MSCSILRVLLVKGCNYRPSSHFDIVSYSDSDWAEHPLDRCSNGGYYTFLEVIWPHGEVRIKVLLLNLEWSGVQNYDSYCLWNDTDSWLILLVKWYGGFSLFFVRWVFSLTNRWWCIVTIRQPCILPIILFFMSGQILNSHFRHCDVISDSHFVFLHLLAW